MKKVSITISGEEVEVDKVIRENSIRKEMGIINISDKKDIDNIGKSALSVDKKELDESGVTGKSKL